MKKVISVLLAAVFALSLFAGCKEKKKEPVFPVTVKGVTIDSAPQKVVVLSPGIAVTAVRLGYAEQIAGICEDHLNPTSLRNVPKVGDAVTPDIEAIVKLGADMLITFMAPTDQDMVELDKAGVKVVVLTAPNSVETLDEYYVDIASCFEGVIDEEHTSRTYVKELKEWTAKLAEGKESRPSFAIITSANLMTAGGDTIESQLFSQILGKNIMADASGYTQGIVDIIRKNPDVLIVTDALNMDLIKGNHGVSGLNAVKNEQVYFVNLNNFELMLPELIVEMCEVAAGCYQK